jgi:hypothetical protein
MRAASSSWTRAGSTIAAPLKIRSSVARKSSTSLIRSAGSPGLRAAARRRPGSRAALGPGVRPGFRRSLARGPWCPSHRAPAAGPPVRSPVRGRSRRCGPRGCPPVPVSARLLSLGAVVLAMRSPSHAALLWLSCRRDFPLTVAAVRRCRRSGWGGLGILLPSDATAGERPLPWSCRRRSGHRGPGSRRTRISLGAQLCAAPVRWRVRHGSGMGGRARRRHRLSGPYRGLSALDGPRPGRCIAEYRRRSHSRCMSRIASTCAMHLATAARLLVESFCLCRWRASERRRQTAAKRSLSSP